MKVLFVTQHFLDHNGGGSFASRAYINAFAEISDAITLLYPDNGNDISNYINSKVKLVRVKNRITNLGKLLDVYKGKIHRYYNCFFPVLKEINPDIVVFDNSRTSAGLIKKVRNSGIKVVTIHHNYEMEYYIATPPHWTFKTVFLYFMKKTERQAVQYSNLNLTLTNEDIELLRKHYDRTNNSLFRKLGCFEYKDSGDSKQFLIKKNSTFIDDSENLIFIITGNLGAYQTEISLVPFLQNYYPVIIREFPDSKLIIAGRNPSVKIKEICKLHSGIELIANPEDMDSIITKAHIYICPVNTGGGLKLRVMDGLKHGLPVITHLISARGYEEFLQEECLFIFDNIETFQIELRNIVKKIKENKISSNRGLTTYANNFSFNSGVTRLKNLLNLN